MDLSKYENGYVRTGTIGIKGKKVITIDQVNYGVKDGYVRMDVDTARRVANEILALLAEGE